jgi:phenylacetate-coenzyme A ligase PaaK-like adenylate-forming protein
MFSFDEISSVAPFSLPKLEKGALYERALADLTSFHAEHCEPYGNIIKGLGFGNGQLQGAENFPFLPVRLFKLHELMSVDRTEVIKTMTSSGTTGQVVSKIFLDRETSANQTKALAKITSNFLGAHRLPMLVIDSKSVLKDRNMFSARGAGILGFSMFGRDVTYALDGNMKLDLAATGDFLEKHEGEDIFIFGFTYIVWEHFYKALASSGLRLPLERGILIHGGGWKKLVDEAVSPTRYKKSLRDVCGVSRVYNYYGMVEQTGSIFMECEEGRMHCSVFSDVIVRGASDFAPCETGESGLVQVISLIPRSYPGHSILTEDLGRVTGIDDCPCGRLGKTFEIEGRVKQAEARGCSDTYEKR